MTIRAALLLAAALAACGPPPTGTPLDAPPIDAERVSLADVLTWPLQRSLAADLDRDGAEDRLVVAADVAVDSAGTPLWEDGHRWAAYVVGAPAAEGADSSRTLLYGAFVPMGRADVAVLEPSVGESPAVLILERGPTTVRALEVEYVGPDSARSLTGAYFHPRRWIAVP